MKKLVIIRGLPGSGKSTLAQKMVNENQDTCHFEDDMFFMHDGKYLFKLEELETAYKWCQQQTEAAIKENKLVVVCSTFTTRRRIKPYEKLALKYGYTLVVYRCTANYGNIHGVTEEVFQKMKGRFEDYPGEILVSENTSNTL